MSRIGPILCILVFLALPLEVFGSGYQVPEQSAKASGQAGAWLARADDAAANWYNPAALVWLEGKELQFGANFLFVGDMDLDQTERFIPASIGGLPVLYDEPVPATYSLANSIETPIHLYYRQRVGERLAWGVGINTPFGLVSEWRDKPVTFSAAKSELLTIMINPNVAFRLDDHWSVALGLDYVRADLKSFSADLFVLAPVITPAGPAVALVEVGRRDLTGDGDDLSWNAALLRRGDPWSFGLTYRHELVPTLEGDLVVSGGFLPSAAARGDLNLPAKAAAGIAWDRGDLWSWELDVEWTQWSIFERLEVSLDSVFLPGLTLRHDWSDTLTYRLGFARRWRGSHEWRAGVLWDEGPGPPDTLRPAIPDTDRSALTFGYGLERARWSVDAYYMALFFEEARAVPGELGVIGGTYEGFGHVAGVTLGRSF